MDAVQELPRDVMGQVISTIKSFMPKLVANAAQINSTKRTTHDYGVLTRHKLDVYHPSTKVGENKPKILFFFYGGGLVSGDRIHKASGPTELVHKNMGHFFSERGFLFIIADYRLVPISAGPAPEGTGGSGEAASYPSGAEDVSLAVNWVRKNLSDIGDVNSIQLSGNSGGGLHIATFLLNPSFYLNETEEFKKSIKSFIFLSAVLDLDTGATSRLPIMKAYFGQEDEDLVKKCAKGLLASLTKDQVAALPPVLSLVGERDPEDEIVQPNAAWWKDWIAKGGKGEAAWLASSEGRHHNHISYLWALSSGEGEEWGAQVIEWIEKTQ